MGILSQIPHTRTIDQTVESFMQEWNRSDYEKLLQYVQITWKDKHPKSMGQLESVLSGHTPGRVEKIIIIQDTGMMADVRVKLLHERGSESLLQMRLVRERKPFQPDKHGIWGVNPASVRVI